MVGAIKSRAPIGADGERHALALLQQAAVPASVLGGGRMGGEVVVDKADAVAGMDGQGFGLECEPKMVVGLSNLVGKKVAIVYPLKNLLERESHSCRVIKNQHSPIGVG